MRDRQVKEFNDALTVVYEELGIIEDVIQAPPGMYNLKQDLSGVDVVPIADLKAEGGEPPESGKEKPPEGEGK